MSRAAARAKLTRAERVLPDAGGSVPVASETDEVRNLALCEELSHFARLSEVSHVSAGLAHELKQPLTALVNYTNVIKRLTEAQDTPLAAKVHAAATKAAEQALRAAQIISRLREFVEKRRSTRVVEDINAIVEDAIALGLLGATGEGIMIRVNFAEDALRVLGDHVQLEQVLVNLLRNAADAMAHTSRRELAITTRRSDDDVVIVRVADTGPGIPDDIAKNLFTPFFTTKPGGMGVGLAISRSIIEAHGGQLTMEPNDGGGTVFQFTLPAHKT